MVGTMLLLIVLVTLALLWLTSCESSKHTTSNVETNTAGKTMDSAAVHRDESGSSTENTWWRELMMMVPKGKDTITNNTTEKLMQPIYYYREGGTEKQEDWRKALDSTFKANKDTSSHTQQSATVDKKTEVLSMWQIIGLIVGLCFLMQFLPIPKLSFKKSSS